MDGHFSRKFNMNNCIQSFFFLQIWKSLDTFALITAENHLACSSGPPTGTESGLMKILDSHSLNPVLKPSAFPYKITLSKMRTLLQS